MKKVIAIICALMLTAVYSQAKADMNESYGKMWQKKCKESKEGLATCCKEKKEECKESAKTNEQKKSCQKKYKACVRKTTTIK